ncbi:MAG: hypothetical protein MJA27_08300 [Pseudanabaenales cyanobacterium]|nr:hypothetical protein [Pseudanabaenales cyanobacterium]
MRKLIHPTAVISIVFLSLTMGGCLWNPPELSLAEAEGGEAEIEFEEAGGEAEGESGEAETGFEAGVEAEGESGEAETEFEAGAEAEGESGEAEYTSRVEAEGVTASTLPLRGNYTLEFTKTTGQSECAQFGEVKDLKVSDNGLMTGELYYSGSRGGPFSGRVRSDGTWSAIGPDEGYKFEGSIRDEEVTGNYTAPAPVPTEGETSCEGTVEGFKTPD